MRSIREFGISFFADAGDGTESRRLARTPDEVMASTGPAEAWLNRRKWPSGDVRLEGP